ncbi:MAG: lipopolysaccharide biosynthesis protein [Nitrospirota bacterium]
MSERIGRRAYFGTFLTSASIQGLTVLQGVITARMLGPAGKGEFAAIILWPNIFAGLGIAGVNMALARRAGKSEDHKPLVRAAIISAGVTGGLTMLLCGLSLPFLIPQSLHEILPAAYLFLLFIPVNHMTMNLLGIDQGRGNFRLLNIARGLLYPVFLLGLLLCYFLAHDRVFWVTVALLAANAIVVAVRLLCAGMELQHGGAHIKTAGILREGFPFFGASILMILYLQFDKTLVVWLLPAVQIGLYAVAFSAASVLSSLNQTIGVVTFTEAARREPGTGFPALAQALRRGAMLSVIGGVILGLALPLLLPFVYGRAFSRAVPLAQLLLPCVILYGLADILNQDLRGHGKPIAGVTSRIAGLAMIGAVSFFLAGRMGAAGIAIGVIAGETVSFIGMLFVAMRFYKDAGIGHMIPGVEDILFFRREIARLRIIAR